MRRVMNRERLQKIRNFQSEDWYPALVIRPITIGVMLIVADWRILTPNRVTTLANLVKLAGTYYLLFPEHWVLAAVLLQVGLMLDHLDGTLARYRRTFTKLGSFYDKVSDLISWALIVMTAGWEQTKLTSEPKWLLFAAASITALNCRSYMKWLSVAETERIRWLEARPDPAAAVAAKTGPIIIKPPPVRTARDWSIWFAKKLAVVFIFEEMDLWFWLGLGLVIRRLDLVLWLFAISQVAGMVGMVVARAVWMNRADKRIRELEAQP
jgi:phosphatidylglycerophosphate synthase